MASPSDGLSIPPENRKWFRLGVVMMFLWAGFLVLLVGLLQWNVTLGLTFAVVAGIVFGVAFTIFVLYVY